MPVEPSVINIASQASQSGGMLFACWAIVIVLALMFVVFMRAHKKDYALAIIPLVILPLAHIFSRLLANALDNILPLTGVELQVAIDMTAGLVSCLLIGLTGRRIQEKRTRPDVLSLLFRLYHHPGVGFCCQYPDEFPCMIPRPGGALPSGFFQLSLRFQTC